MITRQEARRLLELAATRRCPASLLAQVRAQPDVARAAGVITDMSGDSLTGEADTTSTGRSITGGGNPTIGVGIDPQATAFNPMHLASGRWAAAGGEVVIDKNAADKYHFSVGDRTKRRRRRGRLPGQDRRHRALRQRRLARRRDVRRLRRPDGAEAASSSATASRPSRSRRSGRRRDAARRRSCSRSLPATAQVRTGADQAAKDEKDVAGFVKYIRYFLVGFGMVALFVGGVRHLQHALDHGRAAHARARDAADARRLAAAGAPLRRARGVRDRALRVARRPRRRRRARQGPQLALQRARASRCRRRACRSRRGRSSSRCCSARPDRDRGSDPRGPRDARAARSRPCARAPTPRRAVAAAPRRSSPASSARSRPCCSATAS